MDVKMIREWVEALESGDYNQGQGLLKQVVDEGKVQHCCLGVLCEVAGVEWIERDNGDVVQLVVPYREVPVLSASELEHTRTEYTDAFLPYSLAERVLDQGTSDPEVEITAEIAERNDMFREGETCGLTQLNDEGIPFDMIARAIRRHYLGEVS